MKMTARWETSCRKVCPLLVLCRVTFKKLKLEIRSETHDQLTKYVTFYQQAAGVKLNESELVDAALVRAFQDDIGFQSFLSNGGSRGGKSQPAVSGGEGGKGGGQT